MKHDIAVVIESPEHSGRSRDALKHIVEPLEDDFNVEVISCLSEEPRNGKQASKTEIRENLDRVMNAIEDFDYVILVGNTALQIVTGKAGISKRRGKPIELNDRIFLPMNNPSIIRHEPTQADVLEKDLKLFRDIIDFGGVPEEKSLNIRIVASWDDFNEMLDNMNGTVSFDIETTCLYPWQEYEHKQKKDGTIEKIYNPAKIVSLGFGTRDTQWIIPVNHPKSPWDKQEVELMVSEITEAIDDCYVVVHNGKFDMLWMYVHYGVQWRMDFDTMLAHYILNENMPHSLKYIAMMYCGAPDWEVGLDVKQGHGTLSSLAKYHAHDLYYTRELRFVFHKMLVKDLEVKRVFDEILMPCANLFVEVEYDGVYIDTSKFDDAEKYLRGEYDKALNELKKWEPTDLLDKRGRPQKFNWGSSTQLSKLLFGKKSEGGLGIEGVEKTEAGNWSTSESVIKRIDHPCTGDLLKFREAKQQLSFFIDGWKPFLHRKHDGWYLHPSFKLHGTVTGRLSCEHPNLQQVPRDVRIRSLITAPPGWTLIECDLSQIELRVAAELANEENMLSAFRNRIDVHWRTMISSLSSGKGDGYDVVIDATKLLCVRHHLPANGSSAKILLAVFKSFKEGTQSDKFLQLAYQEWLDSETRSGQRGQSRSREQSELGGRLEDLAKALSKESLRSLREYQAYLSSPQGRRPNELGRVQLGDAMSILSHMGPSLAEELDAVWKEQRKKAKAVGFGYLYGMWWKKFRIYARDNYGVNVTDQEAQHSREAFFDAYPAFAPWHDRQRRYARKNGYVKSLSGRKRRLPEAMSAQDTPERREAERQAINSPVQSFANELNLMAAIQLRKEFGRHIVKICGTVHDAILLRCRDEWVERVHNRLLEIMSHPQLMDVFGIDIRVPIEAEGKVGPWGAGKSIKKWLEAQNDNKLQPKRRRI